MQRSHYGYGSTSSEEDENYRTSITLEIEHIYTEEFVSKIFKSLKNNDIQSNFTISYKFSKQLKDKIIERLIKGAIEDAKQKAMVISTTSGNKILKIKNIDYGPDKGIFRTYYRPNYNPAGSMLVGGSSAVGCTFDFCPAEIELIDHIIIQWYIEKF